MEDSIGTIFYIVLAVIALIITVLNKKRKQKATTLVTTEGNKEDFDPFQAFEEDSTEGEVEMPDEMTGTELETPTVQSVLERIMGEDASAFGSDPSMKKQEEMDLKQDLITVDLGKQQEKEWAQAYEARQEAESEIGKIMDEFDLRKAVIHSEIINRKEF